MPGCGAQARQTTGRFYRVPLAGPQPCSWRDRLDRLPPARRAGQRRHDNHPGRWPWRPSRGASRRDGSPSYARRPWSTSASAPRKGRGRAPPQDRRRGADGPDHSGALLRPNRPAPGNGQGKIVEAPATAGGPEPSDPLPAVPDGGKLLQAAAAPEEPRSLTCPAPPLQRRQQRGGMLAPMGDSPSRKSPTGRVSSSWRGKEWTSGSSAARC